MPLQPLLASAAVMEGTLEQNALPSNVGSPSLSSADQSVQGSQAARVADWLACSLLVMSVSAAAAAAAVAGHDSAAAPARAWLALLFVSFLLAFLPLFRSRPVQGMHGDVPLLCKRQTGTTPHARRAHPAGSPRGDSSLAAESFQRRGIWAGSQSAAGNAARKRHRQRSIWRGGSECDSCYVELYTVVLLA
jgi:hypothetical protein